MTQEGVHGPNSGAPCSELLSHHEGLCPPPTSVRRWRPEREAAGGQGIQGHPVAWEAVTPTLRAHNAEQMASGSDAELCPHSFRFSGTRTCPLTRVPCRLPWASSSLLPTPCSPLTQPFYPPRPHPECPASSTLCRWGQRPGEVKSPPKATGR